MMEYRLGSVESRFADIIWECEPVTSAELVKKSAEALGWNRSPTYTVLRRLFRLEDGTVTSLISRDGFYSSQSRQYIDENFNGSLPAFLSAFTNGKRLSEKEVESIRRMIDAYGGGK